MEERKPLYVEGECESPPFRSDPKKVSHQDSGLAPPRTSHDENKEGLPKRRQFKSYNEKDDPNINSNCLQHEGILNEQECTHHVKAIYPKKLDENTEKGRLHLYTSDSRHWNRFIEDCMDIKEIWVQYYELLEMCKIEIDIKMKTTECQLLNEVTEGTGKVHFAFYDCEIKDVLKRAGTNHAFTPAGIITHKEITNSVEPFIIVCYQKNIPAISDIFKQKRSTHYCLLVIDESGDGVDSGVSVLSETCNRNCIKERYDTSNDNITAAIEQLLTRWVYAILTEKVITIIVFSWDGNIDKKQLNDKKYLQQVKEIEELCDRPRHDSKPFLNNENVRQFLSELVEESRALYDRADLPEGDTPPFPPIPKKISYQALEDLKKIKGVLGFGERFGTLNIFLEPELETELETEKDIRLLLQKWEINKAVFRYGSPFIKPYFQPGDKVFEQHCGSLAGFASESEEGLQGKHVYALLAKHVVEARMDTLFINGEDVGKILPIDKYNIDIAAAKIHKSHEKFCSFVFRTEEGDTKASQLYDFNNASKSLSGKRVHLYGAMSSPGLGKISMENLVVKAENYIGVLFEDRKSDNNLNKPLCLPGDSGAMVLTYCRKHDRLEVLGMLIGEQTQTRIKTYVLPVFPEERAEACFVTPTSKSYVGFKMTDGLKDLEKRHGISLSLCFHHELDEDSGISSLLHSAPSTTNSPFSTLENPCTSAETKAKNH